MMKAPKIELNAPVTIGFTVIAFISLIFGYATLGESTKALFTCYSTSADDPMQYVRLVTYIFGHRDMTHFVGNFTTLTLLGPMLEEKYGSKALTVMIFVTALVGGGANVMLSSGAIVGASGIVYMFIILSACTSVSASDGKIPVSLVLVFVLYIGKEVVNGLTVADGVSHSTHILGGICGAVFGLLYRKVPAKS